MSYSLLICCLVGASVSLMDGLSVTSLSRSILKTDQKLTVVSPSIRQPCATSLNDGNATIGAAGRFRETLCPGSGLLSELEIVLLADLIFST